MEERTCGEAGALLIPTGPITPGVARSCTTPETRAMVAAPRREHVADGVPCQAPHRALVSSDHLCLYAAARQGRRYMVPASSVRTAENCVEPFLGPGRFEWCEWHWFLCAVPQNRVPFLLQQNRNYKRVDESVQPVTPLGNVTSSNKCRSPSAASKLRNHFVRYTFPFLLSVIHCPIPTSADLKRVQPSQ